MPSDQFPFMKKHVANLITGSRIILSLFLAFIPLSSIWFYILYLSCGLTDMIYGTIARKTGAVLANSSKRRVRPAEDRARSSRENRVLDAPPNKTSSEQGEVLFYPLRKQWYIISLWLYLITAGVYHQP